MLRGVDVQDAVYLKFVTIHCVVNLHIYQHILILDSSVCL